jgi:HEAT repeat protein
MSGGDAAELLRLLGLESEPLALYAALHLEGCEDPAIRPALLERLETAGAELAAVLLERLGECCPDQLPAELLDLVLDKGSQASRVAALLHWREACSGELDRLLGPRLVTGIADPHVHATMLGALTLAEGPLPEELAEPLLEGLTARDPRVRANAAELAAARSPLEHRAPLCALLGDPVPRVRAAAARGVWEHAPLEVQSRVEADLAGNDPKAQLAALHVLGQLSGYPEARERLLRRTKDESPQIRLMAWRALEGAEDELDGAALGARFLEEDSLACRRALAARAAAGPREAFREVLVGELETAADPRRRSKAVRGLGLVGEAEDEALLAPFVTDADDRVRADVVEALGVIGGKGIDSLLEHALRDPAPRVAANAALALWNRGGEDALQRLLDWLRGEDSSRAASAAFALGEIGSERVVAPLLEVAERLREQGADGLDERRLLKQIMKAIGKVRGT